jgi:Periplasmic protein involved in polysaccharide export
MVRFRPPISSWRQLARALTLLIVCSFSLSAAAQTPEQLEIFRNLSPDQQRAILEAMQGTSGASAAGVSVRGRRPEFPEIVRPRALAEQEASGDPPPASDRLGPGDTILLHLEIIRFEDQREQRAGIPTAPAQAATGVGSRGQSTSSAVPLPPQDRVPVIRSDDEQRRLAEFKQRLERRNPYQLNKWGILNVPELGPIPLSGLSVEEATQRLAAEAPLHEFILRVTRLPLEPIDVDALKPFGYDLFAGAPSTFAPATDVPVPAEYVVGPGDTIEIQLLGNTRGRYSLVVGRDGRIDFPDLGPIAVSGRRFVDIRADLERRVSEQMIGTQAHVTIGELRSIRVFVLGDAYVPGSYTVSGLSTITHALYVSGGVKEIGSLRNIQLKRDGRTVATLDLYDLLLRGDTSSDARLLPGDTVFVPPVGTTVAIAGEVRRPAIYELKGETTVGDLIDLAGGLTADADPRLSTLQRVNEQRQRVTIDLDLTSDATRATRLVSGDVVRIPAIRPVLEQTVTLSGHVYRPGQFQFRSGMRLLDLIPTLDELKPNADLRYILVKRELPPDRRLTVFSANLERALEDPSSAANFELAARDEVYVFDLESGRDRIIESIMRELRMQAQFGEPSREVTISGQIKFPGTYPLELGMRLSDLLRAGGGLSEAAYGGTAEVTRYTVGDDQTRKAELIEIDLRAALDGDPQADIPLRPFDQVVIKEVPLWTSLEVVEIRGEVRFPGRYPIQRGETLSSLLRRAGGLTDFAFPEGAVFTRRELQEREAKQLETLASRMQADLAQLSLYAAQEGSRDASEALSIGQSLLSSLRSTKAVGRLVIDLDRVLSAPPGGAHDVVLKNGDRLLIPRVTQEVTVIGEVQSTTSHLYNPRLSRDDYIAMSGGFTARADKDRIYVVRANGSVETRSGNSWFGSRDVEIRPGDTIVVPLDAERMRPLPLWTAVSQIIYHLAVAVAAVNSF